MPVVAFDSALSSIFAKCEGALAEHLEKVKARAEALQAQDTSRLAFTLTEAIEQEVKPAIDQALAAYDTAINRPITPNARWEEGVRKQIEMAVDAAIAQALRIDAEQHPWKPLLSAEAPKLRERLTGYADQHFVELRKHKKARRKPVAGLPEALVRLLLFVGGAVVGGIVIHLTGL